MTFNNTKANNSVNSIKFYNNFPRMDPTWIPYGENLHMGTTLLHMGPYGSVLVLMPRLRSYCFRK